MDHSHTGQSKALLIRRPTRTAASERGMQPWCVHCAPKVCLALNTCALPTARREFLLRARQRNELGSTRTATTSRQMSFPWYTMWTLPHQLNQRLCQPRWCDPLDVVGNHSHVLTDIAIQVDAAQKRPADAGKLNPTAQRKRLPPQSPTPPQSSLLRKLLAKDIRVERSHLLQAFRFMENHGCALMCFLFSRVAVACF